MTCLKGLRNELHICVPPYALCVLCSVLSDPGEDRYVDYSSFNGVVAQIHGHM